MGKKIQKGLIQANKKEEEDFNPKSIPKSRKNHKIGYNVRFKIVDQILLDLQDFNVVTATSQYKVKLSTIKFMKKQVMEGKYVTLFNCQRTRWNYELEVMNQVFKQQMLVVDQNKQYISALYQLFFKTDIPDLNDAEILDKYNKSQRDIIQKYMSLYNFSSLNQVTHFQNQTKQEESMRSESESESFYSI